MGKVASATDASIFAWALMSNHAHIFLKNAEVGISTFMRKLLSGYASAYNRRHQRHGHLFQNRYKSIACEEDACSLRPVSYIHLNPLRTGLVGSLEELEPYPWSGHSVVMNPIRHDWQDREYVLGYFGEPAFTA